MVPRTNKESTKVSYSKSVKVSGMHIHKLERRGGMERYFNENGRMGETRRPRTSKEDTDLDTDLL